MDAVSSQIDLALTTTSEPRVDTRLFAMGFNNKRRAPMALINKYLDYFEKFGKVLFKKAPLAGSKTGQSESYALLNEDQSYLLLSLSRNNETVVNLKTKLVESFANARRTADLRRTEYLPGYRLLHDRLRLLAAGSTNEGRVHQNVNKLLNKFAGIESGQRATAQVPNQALLIVGQMVASIAAQSAIDHHDGYQRIKTTLQALEVATMSEVALHA